MSTFVCVVKLLFVTLSVLATTTSAGDHMEYVGCYDLSHSLRHNYHHHMLAVTLAECVQFCKLKGNRYAGVEASDNFCYCGDDIADESVQRNTTFCNTPCSDAPNKTCGGDWLQSVYEIQEPIEPDVEEGVLFMVGISTGVRLYQPILKPNYDTLMTTTEWVMSVDFHIANNLLFVHSKKFIWRGSLKPGESTLSQSTIVKNVSQCIGFAVDWVHNRIFWADCGRNRTAIMSMDLNGEAEETVLSRAELVGTVIQRMEIDPYKGIVFWTADGVLQSCKVTGKDFNPNVAKSNMTRALSLDLRARRIYYVGTRSNQTSLFSIDYNGNAEVEHFTVPQLRSVYGLTKLGNKVFWVNYANVRDIIYEAPLNLTRPEEVKQIITIDRAVWHMRVVHPSLQRRPKINPCLDKECSHSCVASGLLEARCECPPGKELQHDGVSCSDTKILGESGVLFLAILMVLAVLLASAVLVYVGDKYWSLLESKLFGISYSRSHDRTGLREGEGELQTPCTEYCTEDDSVNLI